MTGCKKELLKLSETFMIIINNKGNYLFNGMPSGRKSKHFKEKTNAQK